MVSTTSPRLADLGRSPGGAGRRHVVHEGGAEGQPCEHEHLHVGVLTEEAPGPRHPVRAVELDVHYLLRPRV